MPDLPLTMDTLKALAAIVLGCLTFAVTVGVAILRAGAGLRRDLSGQIETTRKESADGRKRMHERLDDLRTHMDTHFVRRDVYEADRRAVQHALEENSLIATRLAGRICPIEADASRRE